ncbi:hypothetical protein [Streptomyces olivaceus]|uniref:hypothetical protein n=1 Tax=Streptomyces olivaceus TaxID=47716 RepID=UPI00248FA296|nr:hypothetical protein [Streptomyces olivaceus]
MFVPPRTMHGASGTPYYPCAPRFHSRHAPAKAPNRRAGNGFQFKSGIDHRISARTSPPGPPSHDAPPRPPARWNDLGNGVTLDFYEKRDEPIQSQHYAFLVPDDRFDTTIARLDAVAVTYYADPGHTEPGRINRLFGGRGGYEKVRALARVNSGRPLGLGARGSLRWRTSPMRSEDAPP